MAYASSISQFKIRQWITENHDVQKIREEMAGQGFDSDTIDAYVKEFNKIKNAKRQTNGFILLAIGAFLGFMSCVLSIINPFPEIYYWILYGFTSLSVIIIFLGLYFLFE